MRRFPLYTQRSNLDCGPTCLRMIAAFHGKKLSMESIRDLCVYSKNGITLLGIAKAAEKIGFKTLGIKPNLKTLANDVPLPAILHWRQEHFVVLYRVKGKEEHRYFYVSDPVGTKFKYSESEMEKCWLNGREYGAALCLEPIADFYKPLNHLRKSKSVSAFLWSYIRCYKYATAQMLLGMFLGSLFMLAVPLLAQIMIDSGIKGKNIQFVWLLLLGQLALVLGYALVEFVRNSILLYVGGRVDILMISDFILKLTKLPISFFDTMMTGDIMQRIGDHQRVKEFLTGTCVTMAFSFANILIFGVVFLYYNVLLAVIYFVGSILYVGWVLFFMEKRAAVDNRMFSLNSVGQNNVFEMIRGMQSIKLDACENAKRWEWERTQVSISKVLAEGLRLSLCQWSGGVLVNQTKNIVITAFVAIMAIKGSMTLGMMLAVQFVMGLLNSPLEQIVTFVKKLQDARLSIGRLNEIYSLGEECHKGDITSVPHASIKISHLDFRYDKLAEKPVLQDVDIVIEKGKTTAIVGLSGSGKTTLLKLLLGFYKPESGNIIIGDRPLQDYNLREWRKKCGVVMQDGFIYSDTIARNIVPTGEIDSLRMNMAAKMANVSEFVETMPLGYDTKIGGNECGISSGQKQRILLARAVYKEPDYLFLDEATNALDTNNENEVMQNLRRFLTGRTCLIVAHRLSTVKDADSIVVLKKGQVVEKGNHSALLLKRGVYYKLVKNQLDI